MSVFYLIPQMVGAGVLVQPLLGLPHWAGVLIVGAVVIIIVVTAGMVSTTWVQFIKGSLLVVFSTVLTVLILARGFHAGSGPVEAQTIVKHPDGQIFVNGQPLGTGPDETRLPPVAYREPIAWRRQRNWPAWRRWSSSARFSKAKLCSPQSRRRTNPMAQPSRPTNHEPTPGSQILRPGEHPMFKGIRSRRAFRTS